jgi:ABC-2 type transport system ATP-binding protein
MIRTQNLTRRFGGVTAVDRLELNVAGGEIFGLVGPDGAGKTTALRLLAGVLEPSDGTAWVDGRDVMREGESLKHRVGYMSQQFGLYADLTVLENIHFYADLYGVTGRERGPRLERLLGFSNLTPFRDRLAGQLSGGMKQKLGLACALIHTPRVLLLDEPTNGVDPVSRRDFWRILYQLLRERVTILFSTAYLDEAERCGRVGLIHQGRLLASGTPDEVKRLMRGTILEVRAPGARAAAAGLRQLEHGKVVGLFGDRVHVVTEEPERATAEIKAAMREREGPVEVRSVAPTLEDVFVSVLGGTDARVA